MQLGYEQCYNSDSLKLLLSYCTFSSKALRKHAYKGEVVEWVPMYPEPRPMRSTFYPPLLVRTDKNPELATPSWIWISPSLSYLLFAICIVLDQCSERLVDGAVILYVPILPASPTLDILHSCQTLQDHCHQANTNTSSSYRIDLGRWRRGCRFVRR